MRGYLKGYLAEDAAEARPCQDAISAGIFGTTHGMHVRSDTRAPLEQTQLRGPSDGRSAICDVELAVDALGV
jgi:hypothetical protein